MLDGWMDGCWVMDAGGWMDYGMRNGTCPSIHHKKIWFFLSYNLICSVGHGILTGWNFIMPSPRHVMKTVMKRTLRTPQKLRPPKLRPPNRKHFIYQPMPVVLMRTMPINNANKQSQKHQTQLVKYHDDLGFPWENPTEFEFSKMALKLKLFPTFWNARNNL